MKYELSPSIFSTIGRTLRSITILFERQFRAANLDLNLSQFVILNILAANDNLILEELSKLVRKDKSAVMRHLNHLENLLWVEKLKDPTDKRRKVLMLTAKGIEVLDLARSIGNDLEKTLTKDLKNKDMEIFSKVLGQMHNQTIVILNENSKNGKI